MRAIVERFKEPSSWAGLSVLWAVFGAKYLPFEILAQIGAGVCAALSFVMSEKKS